MSDKLKVTFYPSGSTVAFQHGEQVAQLQEPWLLLYVSFLAACGVDPCEVEFVMPDTKHARVFEVEGDGYNWQIE